MQAQISIATNRVARVTDAVDLVLAWIDRSRQRSQLAQLDPSVLKDIGISATQAEAECRKHFWQH